MSVVTIGVAATGGQSDRGFQTTVQPMLEKNCIGCHNAKLSSGGLNLESYKDAASAMRDRDKWSKVLARLHSGEMPPKGMPQPDEATRKSAEDWIAKALQTAEAASSKPSAGRVTARRLNRAEYNNTVRDLLGVDFRPADDFPQDDSGYGFDNIADALTLSPVLMEKYLNAAEKVVRTALYGPERLKPTVVRHQPPYREGADGGDNSRFLAALPYTITDYDLTGLTLPSALHTMHTFPAKGVYAITIDPEGNRPRPSDPFDVAVWIDGRQMTKIDFEASDNPTAMEGLDKTVRIRVPAGEHWVAVSALKQYEGLPPRYGGLNPTSKPEPPPRQLPEIKLPDDATPEQKAAFEQRRLRAANGGGRGARPPRITDVSFHVNFIEITGPYEQKEGPSPESLKKIFTCGHAAGAHTPACARKIITDLATHAYRRPAKPEEVTKLIGLFTQDRARGASFERSVGLAIQAMLISPNFLFRVEADPAPVAGDDAEHPISQYELASRLSYFLWSSMPDDELLRVAGQQTLRRPEVLTAQVRRMLKDPKASAFVENFGGQWLQYRALESVKPDPVRFMAFNDYLRLSMRRETELFLDNLVRNDGNILDLLDGRYSFLNEELAQFYGIKGVKGPEFRKVDLTGQHRGGVLTHGSVLTVSSYATRTSVVLRGKWVLENLLNAPVPPPPPNVPALDEAAVGTSMSLRQQMEQHRNNPICASCHARMDPLGFGLENFDAIGRWRTQDGKFPIEASGVLPDGKSFNGPDELRALLMTQRSAFSAGHTEKLLTYALGRGLEAYDKPVVKNIAAAVEKQDYKFSGLVLGIVNSAPFQRRKGDRATE